MKKERLLYLGSMALTLALASCSADEPISKNVRDGLITFRVNTSNQTRALHSYCKAEMPEIFHLWADYNDHANLYIDGDKVLRAGGATAAENSTSYYTESYRYWPAEDIALNFYAYTDDGGKFSFYDKKDDGTYAFNPSVKDFTVETNAADQLDLMYAVTLGAKKGTDGIVKLNFRHALSQICFKAVNNSKNFSISINSISVNNIYGTGTFTIPTSASTTQNYENHTDNVGTQSVISETHDDWVCSTSQQKASFEVSLLTSGKGKEIKNSSTNLTCFDIDSHKQDQGSAVEKSYSKAFNLIPQAQSKYTVDNEDGAYFELDLTIMNVADGDETPIEGGTGIKCMVPVDIDWAEGYRYIYTFNFPENWDPKDNRMIPITYTYSGRDYIESNESDLSQQ